AGGGAGRAPGVTVNRVKRERPVDDTVSILRVDGPAGRPLAAVVGFACHGTCVGGETLRWNADFPHALRTTGGGGGPGVECFFLQGCAGDVAPLDYWFGNPAPVPHGFAARDQVGRALGTEVVRALPAIRVAPDVRLSAVSETVLLPRRRLSWSEADLTRAEARLQAEPEAAFDETWPPGLHTVNSAQRCPRLYQRGALTIYRDLLRAAGTPLGAEVQAVAVGEGGLVGTPFELFNGPGQADRAPSPLGVTLAPCYAPHYLGYPPPTRDSD